MKYLQKIRALVSSSETEAKCILLYIAILIFLRVESEIALFNLIVLAGYLHVWAGLTSGGLRLIATAFDEIVYHVELLKASSGSATLQFIDGPGSLLQGSAALTQIFLCHQELVVLQVARRLGILQRLLPRSWSAIWWCTNVCGISRLAMVASKSLLLELHEFLLVYSIARASVFAASTKYLEVLAGPRLCHLLILHGLWWYVVKVDVQTKVEGLQHGWLHLATLVIDQEILSGSNPLHGIDFWHFVENKSVVLIVHFDHLLLESLLEVLYFQLVLFVRLLLIRIKIFVIFDFFAGQKFDVFYKRRIGTRSVFRLRSNTLVDSIHQQNRVLNFGFDDGPELLDQHAQTAALLLGLLDLLIKQLLTVFEELNQLFVLCF